MAVSGTQAKSVATLQTSATTDTTADPTLGSFLSVNNDTSSYLEQLWRDPLHAGLFLDSSDALTSVSTPPGWTATITQPTLDVSDSNYTGQVSYQAGSPAGNLAPGGELDFSYAVHFAGSTSYQVNATYTANASLVPEPGTLALLLAGLSAAGLLRWRARRRQSI